MAISFWDYYLELMVFLSALLRFKQLWLETSEYEYHLLPKVLRCSYPVSGRIVEMVFQVHLDADFSWPLRECKTQALIHLHQHHSICYNPPYCTDLRWLQVLLQCLAFNHSFHSHFG